jgi:heme A synthase
MKKNTILKIINPILFLLIISQAVTGLLHLKLSPETFETIHEGGGIVLVGLVIVHLILNFNWIRASYFHKQRTI